MKIIRPCLISSVSHTFQARFPPSVIWPSHWSFLSAFLSSSAKVLNLHLCQAIHTRKTAIVSGVVAARKYHHFSETWNCWFPLLSSWKLKNVMLNTAYKIVSRLSPIILERNITEMKVPGRKNIVTAAMVIIDELSRWASLAMVVVAFEIWRLMSLSSCVERWKACDCQKVLSLHGR